MGKATSRSLLPWQRTLPCPEGQTVARGGHIDSPTRATPPVITVLTAITTPS
jgi:hypothetical protein